MYVCVQINLFYVYFLKKVLMDGVFEERYVSIGTRVVFVRLTDVIGCQVLKLASARNALMVHQKYVVQIRTCRTPCVSVFHFTGHDKINKRVHQEQRCLIVNIPVTLQIFIGLPILMDVTMC